MKRESNLFLKDILESIDKIEKYINHVGFEEFNKNSLVYDAVCRNLEIIGEAASHLSQEDYPSINWRDIKGFRNVIIHQYFKIDRDIVWNIIKDKLPILKKEIEKFVK